MFAVPQLKKIFNGFNNCVNRAILILTKKILTQIHKHTMSKKRYSSEIVIPEKLYRSTVIVTRNNRVGFSFDCQPGYHFLLFLINTLSSPLNHVKRSLSICWVQLFHLASFSFVLSATASTQWLHPWYEIEMFENIELICYLNNRDLILIFINVLVFCTFLEKNNHFFTLYYQIWIWQQIGN